MEFTGNVSLYLSFALTFVVLLIFIHPDLRRHSSLIRIASHLHYIIFFAISVAMISLWYLLLNGNMNIEYVASYTSHDLSWIYKISALWAGQSGSLLLWSFILIAFNTAVWLMYRNPYPVWQRTVSTVIMLTQLFFLAMNIWCINPFKILTIDTPDGLIPFTPGDGQGLNPLLHHPAMILHPPILFIGYIGSIIPFAFAVASLWMRDSETWLASLRRWLLFTWLFLTAGIGLGAWWAYAELGWGGYWAWDPVENASLMPWLISTAFLHTLLIQLRNRMFVLTNFILAGGFYFFCILGTFITRSGLINSVHAFSQSNIGFYFLAFLLIILVVFVILLINRRSMFSAGKPVSSFLSNESMAVLLAITLTILMTAVLLGTLFPAIAEGISGKVIMLDSVYYNRVTRFIAVIILIIMIVSNMIQAQRTAKIKPATLILICAILLTASATGIYIYTHHTYISMLSGLLIVTAALITGRFVSEYVQIKTIPASSKFGRTGLFLKIHGGAFTAHAGLLCVYLGVMGSLMNQTVVLEGHRGENFKYNDFQFTVSQFTFDKNPLYESLIAELTMKSNHETVYVFSPEYRLYTASQQPSSEISIYSNWIRDVYVVLTHYDAEKQTGTFQIYFNPLIAWIWIGCILIISGAGLSFYKSDPLKVQ